MCASLTSKEKTNVTSRQRVLGTGLVLENVVIGCDYHLEQTVLPTEFLNARNSEN